MTKKNKTKNKDNIPSLRSGLPLGAVLTGGELYWMKKRDRDSRLKK
jgi:hypothetical protein